MKLEVLLSTMNLKNYKENIKLVHKENITTNSLTINQITNSNIEEFNNANLKEKNRIITKNEIGLSRSRNLAIKESKADICILADDDLIYEKDYDKIIKEEYQKNKNIDIICFFVESNNKTRRIKRMITSKIDKLRAMRICSFQITFRRKSIMEHKIKFDENFGAGTYFDRGEETIFLWECINKGLKVKFVNKKIATVNQQESNWFKGYDKTFFEKQGAVFYRMSSKFYRILILQFAIRKYGLYKKELKVKEAISNMMLGANKYKEEQRYKFYKLNKRA